MSGNRMLKLYFTKRGIPGGRDSKRLKPLLPARQGPLQLSLIFIRPYRQLFMLRKATK